jgi:hypothetical protein
MRQTKIQLDPETLQAMKQTEASIQEWSVRHTHLVIQARGAESTVNTLYTRRQGIIQKFVKETGLDASRIVHIEIGEDGVATVNIAPDGPGNGQPVPEQDVSSS